jgi:hypothetical protein
MATLLEAYTTKEQSSVVHFFVGKGYYKKFIAYSGKCLSHKSVHNWVDKFSQECSKVADDA